jgi:hypothetical protein
MTFGKSLEYRDSDIVGNVKVLWELGRHQHLVPMAMKYAQTGDLRYKNAVLEQLKSWIDQNPYGIGIHWCSALEVSLRLVSWAVIHSFFVLRDGDDGLLANTSDNRRIQKAIYQQCYFVRYFLSRYSSANNHLIGELTGLWTACCVFDLGTKGDTWRNFAEQELLTQARLQVFPDGVNKEQACYYHLWVLEYFIFAWITGERYGYPFPEAFRKVIIKMYYYLKDIAPDGGIPPQIGDADDGFVVRFETKWPKNPYKDILQAVETIFDNVVNEPSAKAYWYSLVVNKRQKSYPDIHWVRKYPMKYPDGGYAIVGNSVLHLVFDAGPLGYLGIAAHGHADALSFCLAVDGEWWIVDPGTYAYHTEAVWRDYFRGTFSHNTVTINRENQSRIGGPFMWVEKANSELEQVNSKSGVQEVSGYHDGYLRLGVRHSRNIKLYESSNTVTISDHLECTDPVDMSIQFHFAPEIQVLSGDEPDSWILTKPGSSRRLLLKSLAGLDWRIMEGENRPISGWYSPALGQKVPTKTLVGQARIGQHHELLSTLKIE